MQKIKKLSQEENSTNISFDSDRKSDAELVNFTENYRKLNHSTKYAAVSTFLGIEVNSALLCRKMSREELNTILNRFTSKTVQLRSESKAEALKSWEPIVKGILDRVKVKDRRFNSLQTFPTGGYYERTKVIEPDEFDLMLVMDNLELDGKPYDSDDDDGLSEPPIGMLNEEIIID